MRVLLARKLAALVPTLSPADQARLSQETWDTLKALVADETARVRAVIAEAVKELPDAPRELILRLARRHGDLGLRAGHPAVAAAGHRGLGGLGDDGARRRHRARGGAAGGPGTPGVGRDRGDRR